MREVVNIAPQHRLVAVTSDIHVLRDPTRGGMAPMHMPG